MTEPTQVTMPLSQYLFLVVALKRATEPQVTYAKGDELKMAQEAIRYMNVNILSCLAIMQESAPYLYEEAVTKAMLG